jgi:protein TonB
VERARPRTTQRGVVRVTLTVARDGRLLGAGIAASSGNAELDRAALRMVQGAGRFRPAPAGLEGADYAFRLPIRFD